jgi:hypothetical protein
MTWRHVPETDCPSAPEPVALIWASCLQNQTSTPAAMLNGKSIPDNPSSPPSGPDTLPQRQSGTMSPPLTEPGLEAQLTPCWLATLVSRSQQQASAGGELADTSGTGPQRREQRGSSGQRDGAQTHGSTAQRGRPWLFPPGPSDGAAWSATLAMAPDLAPAVSLGDVKRACDYFAQMVEEGHMAEAEAQSTICRMADGLSQRSRALRLLGNGVHGITAANAWRSLADAHGLRPLDLGTADHHTPTERTSAEEPV